MVGEQHDWKRHRAGSVDPHTCRYRERKESKQKKMFFRIAHSFRTVNWLSLALSNGGEALYFVRTTHALLSDLSDEDDGAAERLIVDGRMGYQDTSCAQCALPLPRLVPLQHIPVRVGVCTTIAGHIKCTCAEDRKTRRNS